MCSFTPSIVQGLGYTASRAQLMTVPPFGAAFVGKHFGTLLKIKSVTKFISTSPRAVFDYSSPPRAFLSSLTDLLMTPM
jgi:hypothetical protein